MVAKNRMKVTMKRKIDSVDIEMIKVIGLRDRLDRNREGQEEGNGLSKWIDAHVIYCEKDSERG